MSGDRPDKGGAVLKINVKHKYEIGSEVHGSKVGAPETSKDFQKSFGFLLRMPGIV